MYLIPFWDWIPTVAAHRYYCEKEASFFVYKTVEQWKSENPGVADTLARPRGVVSSSRSGSDVYQLNQRFDWEVSQPPPFFLSLRRRILTIVDSKTSEIIAKDVDFSTGSTNVFAMGAGSLADLKFWQANSSCIEERPTKIGEMRSPLPFYAFMREIEQMGSP